MPKKTTKGIKRETLLRFIAREHTRDAKEKNGKLKENGPKSVACVFVRPGAFFLLLLLRREVYFQVSGYTRAQGRRHC